MKSDGERKSGGVDDAHILYQKITELIEVYEGTHGLSIRSRSKVPISSGEVIDADVDFWLIPNDDSFYYLQDTNPSTHSTSTSTHLFTA